MKKYLSYLTTIFLALQMQIPRHTAEAVNTRGSSNCILLRGTDFSALEDAPTHVTASELVEADRGTPAHCRAQGYVTPQIGFEVFLPTTWNGKFIERGCGGFCGYIDREACIEPLRRGYACIVSDMGHRGKDGLWAYNNLQAKIDWAYRGAHVSAIAGKAIVERYYGYAARKSYFEGCSNGGRQALIEAQRFPWDFDGIIAGAPSINFSANSMAQVWASVATQGLRGEPILNRESVILTHNAVLSKCDMDDGVRDGVVSDPRNCRFEPEILACKAIGEKKCLLSEQIAAVKKIYAGPFVSTESIADGGFMPGSELGWVGSYFGADGGLGFLYSFDAEKFRYAIFFPDPGATWKVSDLNFELDYKRLGMMEALYSASNPDLRQFKRKSGKLILYQGWNDQLEPPTAITDYYETAERVIGSRSKTQDFLRLFMIPGMNHCGKGEGAWFIDYLLYLEQWSEHDSAPEKLIGAHPRMPSDPVKAEQFINRLRGRIRTSDVEFTRPIYPYPLRAVYKGTGDTSDARNFVPSR